jgi:hypothetical protein
MMLFPEIPPKVPDWIVLSLALGALPPKKEGEFSVIVIPSDDIVVNNVVFVTNVVLINTVPTAELFQSMTYGTHLTMGEVVGVIVDMLGDKLGFAVRLSVRD